MTAITMQVRPTAGGTLAGSRRASATAPRMRLTARGRAARRVLVAVLTLAAVVLIAWQAAGAGREQGPERVLVGEGQALSHVAVKHLPEVPVERGVLLLQEANDLGTSQVQAGQELVIPQP